jgi:hypothetical protein
VQDRNERRGLGDGGPGARDGACIDDENERLRGGQVLRELAADARVTRDVDEPVRLAVDEHDVGRVRLRGRVCGERLAVHELAGASAAGRRVRTGRGARRRGWRSCRRPTARAGGSRCPGRRTACARTSTLRADQHARAEHGKRERGVRATSRIANASAAPASICGVNTAGDAISGAGRTSSIASKGVGHRRRAHGGTAHVEFHVLHSTLDHALHPPIMFIINWFWDILAQFGTPIVCVRGDD